MRGHPSNLFAVRGFTIVEVLVTVTVIAILAGIVVSSDRGFLARSRDVQRANSVATISRALERYYRTNATVSGPTYPDTSMGSAGIASIVDDSNVTNAPDSSSNAIVMAINNSAQTPTVSQYTYQPLTSSGSICTTAPCVRYKLYYRQETDSTVISIDSVRQQ